jgi:hypothetical protein
VLVRELTGSRPAAFIPGLIFGLYPFRFEHDSHLELQMAFWMPLRFACAGGSFPRLTPSASHMPARCRSRTRPPMGERCRALPDRQNADWRQPVG